MIWTRATPHIGSHVIKLVGFSIDYTAPTLWFNQPNFWLKLSLLNTFISSRLILQRYDFANAVSYTSISPCYSFSNMLWSPLRMAKVNLGHCCPKVGNEWTIIPKSKLWCGFVWSKSKVCWVEQIRLSRPLLRISIAEHACFYPTQRGDTINQHGKWPLTTHHSPSYVHAVRFSSTQ